MGHWIVHMQRRDKYSGMFILTFSSNSTYLIIYNKIHSPNFTQILSILYVFYVCSLSPLMLLITFQYLTLFRLIDLTKLYVFLYLTRIRLIIFNIPFLYKNYC